MISAPSPDAKMSARFAAPPWNEHLERWRHLNEQLPHDHLAREIRDAMLTSTWRPSTLPIAGVAKPRPDLMLAIVLFELRRGQRQPSQWYQDTHENDSLWWLGFGIGSSRSCWYEFRNRTGAYIDTLNATLLHRAIDEELTTAERGALDGSAVAANTSRRLFINPKRLEKRLQ